MRTSFLKSAVSRPTFAARSGARTVGLRSIRSSVSRVHAPYDDEASSRSSRALIAAINARLDRLDAASAHGAWTRETLDLIDLNPTVRAPDLAAQVGRETADFKKDVRKLKELGLTESRAIGYLLSPRGEAVVDAGLPTPRVRAPRQQGTPLPRSIGAPATRALREVGVTTVEQVATHSAAGLAAIHGVGPIAIARLREAMAEQGLAYAGE